MTRSAAVVTVERSTFSRVTAPTGGRSKVVRRSAGASRPARVRGRESNPEGFDSRPLILADTASLTSVAGAGARPEAPTG